MAPERNHEIVSAVTDEELQAVAEEVVTILHGAVVQATVQVGELLVERFYDGDLELMRSHARKDNSLRRLAELPMMPSAATLHRAVELFALSEALGGVSTWKHLGVSHFAAVFPLERKRQKQLLDRAEEHGWTVRQLEQEARKDRPAGRSGRPRMPVFQKTVRGLQRVLDDEGAFADLEKLDELNADDVKQLHTTVQSMENRLRELKATLRTRMPGFESSSDKGEEGSA